MTKIYTRTGDRGKTSLATGKRVEKTDPRIEAYGTIDELNAVLGLLRDTIMEADRVAFGDLGSKMFVIQCELFDIGCELAVPTEDMKQQKQQLVGTNCIQRLENEIDLLSGQLPPLANFVVPGGHVANSAAHVARTVCRRAERLVIGLSHTEQLRAEPQQYLNRLSDWLFVCARYVSMTLNVKETIWKKTLKDA